MGAQPLCCIYRVWCRRTDELIDGINGSLATPEVLDKWEERLVDIFEGRPHDIYDAALHDAISKYSLDMQLLKDLIEGMRMDMRKTRYDSFGELDLYSYHVAGTVTMGIVQILGVSPDSKAPAERIYTSVVSFGLTLQLTDILRDISEDARRGRLYLPLDEIANAGISEDHIFDGGVMMTRELRNYVKAQIKRARMYADEGDVFIKEMRPSDQTLLWMLSLMNRQMLDRIEDNGYDLTKPTPMGLTDVSATLHGSLVKSHI